MAAPVPVRVVPVAPTVAPAIGVNTAVGWGTTKPTAGRRLLCVVAHNDNGTVATPTLTGTGWSLVLGPINRINNQLISIYEKLSAAGTSADDLLISFDHVVYPSFALIEVSGAHATTPTDATGSNSGSAQTLSAGASGSTTRDDVLWIAAFASGNIQTHSNPLPAGFTLQSDLGNGGSSDATKITLAVTTKAAATHPDSVTPTVDVAGGFNHNYAALLVGIPGTGAGGTTYTGQVFGLPNTLISGLFPKLCSLHYFQGGVRPTGATDAQATANAQKLAGMVDLIVGNVIQNASTGAFTTDKFQGKIAAMKGVNPDLVCMPYDKSAEIDEGTSYFPNDYYAHQCPWPTGAKVNVYSGAVWIAQPSVDAGQSAFVDPRGWTSHSFKEQRIRDSWSRVTAYNSLHGADQLSGIYLDSMNVWNAALCNPATNTAYTQQAFVDRVWSIGDEGISRRPNAAYPVFGNGMGNGPNYWRTTTGAGKNQILHLDGGLAEFWLWPNYPDPGQFYNETQWQQCIDMVYDMNIVKGKTFMGVCNLENTVAIGGQTTVLSNAEKEQRRRYFAASGFIAKQTSSFFEFCDTVQIEPWDEDHPYYRVNMGGTPIDLGTGSALTDFRLPLHGAETTHAYRRRYPLGAAWVNPTASPVTIVLDRAYKDPVNIGSATYASGSTLVMQPNTGLILLTQQSGTNAGAPVVTFTYPPSSTPFSNVPVQVFASDPDGIASAEYNLNGGGWLPLTFQAGNGDWEARVNLNPGANSIQARATDANAAPLTSAPVTQSVTLLTNSGPPTVTIDNPAASVAVSVQTIQVSASDPDGVSSAEYTLNGSAWTHLTFNATSGKWEASVSLVEGNNTIQARATDAFAGGTQTSAAVSLTVVLTSPTPPPPPPPAPVPDPNAVPSLGSGAYSAKILTRGGATIVVQDLPWSGEFKWNRKGQAISGAKVVVGGQQVTNDLCSQLATVHAFQHELAIYYAPSNTSPATMVWVGPIVQIDEDPSTETMTFTAQDLGVWFTRRRLRLAHNYAVPGTDAATILSNYLTDAMAIDASPNIGRTIVPSRVRTVASVVPDQHTLMSDAIAPLVADGLYYHLLNRKLVTADLVSNPVVATKLMDEHFLRAPVETEDGMALASDWGIRGQGGGEVDVVWGEAHDDAARAAYGVIEKIDSTDAETNQAATLSAVDRLAQTNGPQPVISSGTLAPNAPITYKQLRPGMFVELILTKRCRAVSGIYVIDEVITTPKPDGSTDVEVVWL